MAKQTPEQLEAAQAASREIKQAAQHLNNLIAQAVDNGLTLSIRMDEFSNVGGQEWAQFKIEVLLSV